MHHQRNHVSVNTLREWLGHESLDVTLAYLKGSEKLLREAEQNPTPDPVSSACLTPKKPLLRLCGKRQRLPRRMSDLLALQPKLDINLYLVAPDERRDKVEQELLRPTFSLREKPLSKLCGFLPFNSLCEKIDGIRKLGLSESLKPNFLKTTAEFFIGEEEPES